MVIFGDIPVNRTLAADHLGCLSRSMFYQLVCLFACASAWHPSNEAVIQSQEKTRDTDEVVANFTSIYLLTHTWSALQSLLREQDSQQQKPPFD